MIAKRRKKKRGQMDNPVILLGVLVIGLILFAPIMMKILLSVKTGVGSGLGNISGRGGEISKANFDVVMTTGINYWDKVLLFAFISLVVLMLISAFLVDSHPAFLILYIISTFFLVVLAPNIITAADNIYNSPEFAEEINYLSFMDALREYYIGIIIGLIVVTGIIIFGKVSINRTGGARR